MTTRCLSDVYGGNVGHLKNIHELTGSDFAGFAIPVDFYIGLAKKAKSKQRDKKRQTKKTKTKTEKRN